MMARDKESGKFVGSPKRNFTCTICQEEFYRYARQGRTLFCSLGCKGIASRGKSSPMKGVKMSEEARTKMSIRKKILYISGWRPTFLFKKGVRVSPETEFRLGQSPKNYVPISSGSIYELRRRIRKLVAYKEWRRAVLERDSGLCALCGEKGLEVDHITTLRLLIEKYNIKSLEEAKQCNELWDLENGRTLCSSCHRKTPTYGNYRINFQKQYV